LIFWFFSIKGKEHSMIGRLNQLFAYYGNSPLKKSSPQLFRLILNYCPS
jgi:hypothetical protein